MQRGRATINETNQNNSEKQRLNSPMKDYFLHNSMNTPMTDILCKWSSSQQCRIIYTTERFEFSTKAIWSVLHGRRNVMCLVVTDNDDVFGSFHSLIPERRSAIVSNDKKHFVFTLRNSFNIQPTRFFQNSTNENQMIIHRDYQNSWVFGVGYGYHIRSEGKSYIGSASGEQLQRGYCDHIGLNSDIFTRSHYPDHFNFSQIIFLQMY
ncbi:hypothetical protein EIN_026420 [Entamoeba invadens IP1]|uniref:hypothetical protein n=1 Tax=Entamoeba invadens IP1 TaxID=370355 RepID=UPI0002C3DEB6|nr:hypothetical protein EIN_026420 [Entamoeba invadens IP1]ELP90783.1 hypothetical protein EIN_026420 [Entamoeba invadens IP1]|eukprot:XP_004257554.1 hypothetical protein EIN_026420 [Entamoeba invadens IP1]